MTDEPRKFLTSTTNYKVHFATNQQNGETYVYNVVPTTELVVQTLICERDRIEEPDTRNMPLEAATARNKPYERILKRYENLIELVRLVGTLRIPNPGDNESHKVVVAGVEIGFLTITARKAWTLE